MAKGNPLLIKALNEAAENLEKGARYEWGHMGRCNCGHLVQAVTKMTDIEIVESVEYQLDEWTEHARDYCDDTSTSLDHIFETMKAIGFDHQDMIQLEYLSDKKVLWAISNEGKLTYLTHNNPSDVALYMRSMARLLEEELN